MKRGLDNITIGQGALTGTLYLYRKTKEPWVMGEKRPLTEEEIERLKELLKRK